jgi:hypothetical protein
MSEHIGLLEEIIDDVLHGDYIEAYDITCVGMSTLRRSLLDQLKGKSQRRTHVEKICDDLALTEPTRMKMLRGMAEGMLSANGSAFALGRSMSGGRIASLATEYIRARMSELSIARQVFPPTPIVAFQQVPMPRQVDMSIPPPQWLSTPSAGIEPPWVGSYRRSAGPISIDTETSPIIGARVTGIIHDEVIYDIDTETNNGQDA